MNCSRCQRLLAPLREGTLRPRVARAAASHLAACDACRMVADAQGRVGEVLAGFSPPPLRSSLRETLLQRVAREAPVRPIRPRADWFPRWAPAATAAALCFALTAAVWLNLRGHTDPSVAIARVVVGEVEHRVGADGQWHPLRAGDLLPERSQLMSRENGMAIVETDGGVSLSMAQQTAVSIVDAESIAWDGGRMVASASEGLRVHTPVGAIVFRRAGGSLAISSEAGDDPGVAMGPVGAVWENETSGSVILPAGSTSDLIGASGTTRPTRVHFPGWTWLQDLEQARARELLRETHPSLLPPLAPSPGR